MIAGALMFKSSQVWLNVTEVLVAVSFSWVTGAASLHRILGHRPIVCTGTCENVVGIEERTPETAL